VIKPAVISEGARPLTMLALPPGEPHGPKPYRNLEKPVFPAIWLAPAAKPRLWSEVSASDLSASCVIAK